MFAVAGDGIGAVGDLIAFGGEELGLAAIGPAEPGALKLARIAGAEQRHLLQEHQVGVQRLDAQPEVVDFQTLARPEPRTPLWML